MDTVKEASFMKKFLLILAIALFAVPLAACQSGRDFFNAQTTVFDSLQVETKEDSIISDAEVFVCETEGVLLTVEAPEEMDASVSWEYKKESGELKIYQQFPDSSKELLLNMGEEEAKEAVKAGAPVHLKKGVNEFLIGCGNKKGCRCQIKFTLEGSGLSGIAGSGGGTLKV